MFSVCLLLQNCYPSDALSQVEAGGIEISELQTEGSVSLLYGIGGSVLGAGAVAAALLPKVL